jgi:hypothetical protein
MSGMADSIRERGAREVPEREEGVEKMRSTILSLTKLFLIMMSAAIAATIGAILSVDVHWLLVIFSLTAAIGYGGAIYVLLLLLYQYRELKRLRR